MLDNLSTGKLDNLAPFRGSVEFIEVDLTDAAAVTRTVVAVDCIFHEAALASVPRSVERPLDTHAACATGTVMLLDAARKAGVWRLVYAALSSAYGDQPTSSKREIDLPLPISPYGAAKLAGEIYRQAFAATYAIETVCLWYFNVFGPRQDPAGEYSAVIPKFITLLLAGKRPTVFGDGQQSRDFTYIANMVQGNQLAAHAPDVSGRVFNVGDGQLGEPARAAAAAERTAEDRHPTGVAPSRIGDVRARLAEITAARRLLAHEPEVTFAYGLQRSILSTT